MRVLLVIMLLGSGACAGGAGPDRPEVEDCARLQEHIIDLRLAAADTTGRLSSDDLAQHRSALQAAGAATVADCPKRQTRSEVSCLLATTELDSLRTCAPTTDPED
jgi:hypothetical protein